MPEISVILPVFNAEGFISDSVQSILSQSFKDFELILIDDASHDNTSKILDALADERIRHIRHDKNMGLVFSLNEGLNLARGNFIARMDHDDIAFPCRFAKQLKFFMDNQSVGLVGTGYRLISSEGELGPIYVPPSTHDEISWAMSVMCPIAHSTVMAKRELFLNEGGYSTRAAYAEDYDFWERLSRKVKVANLPEPLLLLRKHKHNMTNIWSEKNLATAVDVSSRRIQVLLGTDVNRDLVKCIHTRGHSCPKLIPKAQKLLLALMDVCVKLYPSARQTILRDNAIRIAIMGLMSRSAPIAFLSFYIAMRLSPFFYFSLLQRFKSKRLRWGKISLIG